MFRQQGDILLEAVIAMLIMGICFVTAVSVLVKVVAITDKLLLMV